MALLLLSIYPYIISAIYIVSLLCICKIFSFHAKDTSSSDRFLWFSQIGFLIYFTLFVYQGWLHELSQPSFFLTYRPEFWNLFYYLLPFWIVSVSILLLGKSRKLATAYGLLTFQIIVLLLGTLHSVPHLYLKSKANFLLSKHHAGEQGLIVGGFNSHDSLVIYNKEILKEDKGTASDSNILIYDLRNLDNPAFISLAPNSYVACIANECLTYNIKATHWEQLFYPPLGKKDLLYFPWVDNTKYPQLSESVLKAASVNIVYQKTFKDFAMPFLDIHANQYGIWRLSKLHNGKRNEEIAIGKNGYTKNGLIKLSERLKTLEKVDPYDEKSESLCFRFVNLPEAEQNSSCIYMKSASIALGELYPPLSAVYSKFK